ncbi:MAG: sulfatase-like hydrolase/transferase, partial [Planctomycetota bacterium]
GRYASSNRCFDNKPASHLGPDQPTLLEHLKQAGYRIGLAGKNHTFKPEFAERLFDDFQEYSPWGKTHGTMTDGDRAVRTFRNTTGPDSQIGNKLLEGLIDFPEPFPQQQCMTARIADDAIAFARKHAGEPFFLHMSFPASHWPNVVCEPYFSQYRDRLGEIELAGMDSIDWSSHPFAHYVQSQIAGFDTMSKGDRQKLLAIMYGQISFVDRSVGRLIEALKEIGQYDDSIIVFTSDQGCFGGQFGLPCKTKGYYESLIRIPLVIKLPASAGEVADAKPAAPIESLVENIDVMPTLLEMAGIGYSASDDSEIDGRSFAGVLRGETEGHRQEIYAEVGTLEPPPPAISEAAFAEQHRKRSAEDMFWFVEYTMQGRSAMLREAGWKYCYYVRDREELYHYADDPLELTNLAEKPEHAERKQAMQEKLFAKGFVGIGDEP